MTGKLTVSRKLHIAREGLGRKRFREGEEAAKPAGRVQRVSRLMALAIECDRLIREGVIKNQSELAHYAQVTTARMTHIMWMTNLAPEIQEAILFLPRAESGPDSVKEIEVREIARVMDWGVQRVRWSVNRLTQGRIRSRRWRCAGSLGCWTEAYSGGCEGSLRIVSVFESTLRLAIEWSR